VVFIITVSATFSSNFGFLYVKFNYGEVEQEIATVALGFYNFLWDLFVLRWLFTTPLLHFGVKKDTHNAFIARFVGNEIHFLFSVSSLGGFWIPLITVLYLEESCFHGLFVASAIVKTKYEVNQCAHFYVNGTCIRDMDVQTSLTIDSPFLYNYSCSSTLLRTYIPVFMSQNVIVIFAVLFQLYYLSWYTKHQDNVESDVSYYGMLLRLPKRLFMENRLLMPFYQREMLYMEDLAASKVSTAQKFERSWTTYTFVFADHMSSLLVLFTFGVFAPLLALSIILSICARLYINQLLLGRCICIEAGTLAFYHERVKDAEEYVVSNDQGTSLRLKPDFISERLRSLQLGDTVKVALSIVEKPVSD
jgi:hypothetical protein